jgi:hypothetical protein
MNAVLSPIDRPLSFSCDDALFFRNIPPVTPEQLQAAALALMRRRKGRHPPQTDPWRTALLTHLRTPHPEQAKFLVSPAKRKVIRAGRRAGKTVGLGILAGQAFAAGKRVLYAVPTQDQLDRFWFEVTLFCAPFVAQGILYKNETRRLIEVPGTLNRLRAKSAWNAATLRGDYADVLILDEYQDIDEDAWERVGAPMMLDNNGDAVFCYTSPWEDERTQRKRRGLPHNAIKMYKAAEKDTTGRSAAFKFSSYANPHISAAAIEDMKLDMSERAIRVEILAEEDDIGDPNALWKPELIVYKTIGE